MSWRDMFQSGHSHKSGHFFDSLRRNLARGERALGLLQEDPFAFHRKVMEQLHFRVATPIVNRQVKNDPRMSLGERTSIQGVGILQAKGPDARIKIGNDVVLYRSCQLSAMGQGQIEVGDFCTFGSVQMYARDEISIGNYVLFSFGIFIQDYDPHPIDPIERRQDILHLHGVHPDSSTGAFLRPVPNRPVGKKIRIEDDVWIGANVTILKGVTIGRGSIIGAGSVVAKDIPPMSIAVGSPARVIRTLTGEERESNRELLQIAS